MSEIEFLQLLSLNQGIIYKICNVYGNSKEDRDDLFQEITFQAWKGYPHFKGKSKFSTWLYRIALNTALTSFRKKRPVINYLSELPDFITDEETTAAKARQTLLLDAIKQLNETDKAVITLYLEELSYQEIADIMGISETNVGVKINRIKSKLQSLLKNGNN